MEDELPPFARALGEVRRLLAEPPAALAAADGVAASLCSLAQSYCLQGQILRHVRRGLFLMAPELFDDADTVSGLVDPLETLEDTEPSIRGISRLLEAAVQAGDSFSGRNIAAATRRKPEGLQRDILYFGKSFDVAADLSDALSVHSPTVIAALFADGLMDFIFTGTDHADAEIYSFGQSWLQHRGAREEILRLYTFQPHLLKLSEAELERAEREDLVVEFAYWLLCERISYGHPLCGSDEDYVRRLLKKASLSPPEVFDAADYLTSA